MKISQETLDYILNKDPQFPQLDSYLSANGWEDVPEDGDFGTDYEAQESFKITLDHYGSEIGSYRCAWDHVKVLAEVLANGNIDKEALGEVLEFVGKQIQWRAPEDRPEALPSNASPF